MSNKNKIRRVLFSFLITSCMILILLGTVFSNNVLRSGRNQLTFEERVRAQEAVERVYYNHLIWPSKSEAKPTFEGMISKDLIKNKVENYLKQSSALELYWRKPITAEQLQAEMNRMARETQDPKTLKELFSALGNDPILIAECLARPILADRLIRNWYSYDERFHKDKRLEAEELLKQLTPYNFANPGGDNYHKVRIRLEENNEINNQTPDQQEILKLDREAFEKAVAKFPAEGSISEIEETKDAYIIRYTERKEKEYLDGGVIVLSKISFDLWWERASKNISLTEDDALLGSYQLPEISGSSFNFADDFWLQSGAMNNQTPSARYVHRAVWTGSEMIIWGGWDGSNYLNTGARYNPAIDSWSAMTTIGAPSGRKDFPAVWTGSEMIIWGGWNGSILNTGGRYNPSNDTWTATHESPSSGRYRHSGVWTGSEMIIWGGYPGYLNTGYRYNPSSGSWVYMSTSGAPEGRINHSAVWTGSVMIVWGGEDDSSHFNTGGRYNPSNDSWQGTTTGGAPSAREDNSYVWTGSEMIIWGGYYNGNYFNTGGRYNPSTDSWQSTSTTGAPDPRRMHTAVWTGSEMIIWGGDIWGDPKTTGGRYNPTTNSWQATTTTGAPSRRDLHTAVWTGLEMIIWGGTYSSSLNTGSRYDPEMDAWFPTRDFTTSARAYHTAIWTGSEMIVWGGYDGSTNLNSGEKYDRATANWSATSTGTNCPSARQYHTSAWTGSEMIIWGGSAGSANFNTGGRYNPTTNSWQATNTTDAASERYLHTAVWTGSEMIVWGGRYGTSTYLNTGGRYSPSTNSWQATTTTGAPTERHWHTAIWTGSEMVVWGGAGTAYYNTGGRYTPSTNIWQTTNTTGAPQARRSHTAVWTNSEMIVWGGYGGSNFNTGGRYNPTTDNWQATTTTGAPTARMWHSAVWTGSEMIIWGGSGGSAANTGARYNPTSDSWIATTTASPCPSARYRHSAVWADSEMIVWGGNDSSYYDNGGIYAIGCTALTGVPNNVAKDNTACEISGIKVVWRTDVLNWGDNGTGTRTYDILRNDTPIASGIAYGTRQYIDTTATPLQTYTYKVRYNNGCGMSAVTSGANAFDDYAPEPARLYKITDANGCVQDGIAIYFNTTDAQRHDLYMDGNLVITDYVSGKIYDPGDTNSHTYFLRAWSPGCYSDTISFDYSDGADTRDVEFKDAIAVWRFDENNGTTAGDSWNTNHGTLTNGPVWITGHSNSAIDFDGIDDYVSVPSNSSLNPTRITVTAWIRADSWANESWRGSIVTKDAWPPTGGWALRCGNQGRLSFVISAGGAWYEALSGPIMQLNTWTHVAGSYDGQTVKVYINGVERASTPVSGQIDSSTVEINIGRSAHSPDRIFDGVIDEVAIFGRALNGNEIVSLYEKGTFGDGIPNACDNCPYSFNTDQADADNQYPTGIVSAWHFNEGSGSTAEDTPGNNNGTLINGPLWSNGYRGNGIYFDGVNDYVRVPNSASLNPDSITVSAWIKAEQWGTEPWRNSIVSKDSSANFGYILRCGDNGRLSFVANYGGTWQEAQSEQIMELNKWTHVAGTISGTGSPRKIKVYINGVERASLTVNGTYTKSSVELRIGESSGFSGRLFKGTIDEVAIFNRALSDVEINELYMKGFSDGVGDACDDCAGSYDPGQEDRDYPSGVISAWHFDNSFGTVAEDTPGNNDGSIHGPVWASGYSSNALQFDGTNDYVEVPHANSLNPGTELTLMGWVNLVNSASNQKIIGKRPGSGYGYIMGVASGKLYPEIWDSNGTLYSFQSGTISSNTWTHLAVTWKSGGEMIGYINGTPIQTISASSNPIASNTSPLRIGSAPWNNNAFVVNGLIDELAIFNRALNANEIMTVYQNGFRDGSADACEDCAPGNIDVWAPPSVVLNLIITKAATGNITWDAPQIPGCVTPLYDVLRSENPSDFTTATCITSDITNRTATDTTQPSPSFYYLIRVENTCGSNMGTDSSGTPRTSISCP